MMHIRKNICNNLVSTLLELDGENKDTFKVGYDCEALCTRRYLRVQPTEIEKDLICPYALYYLNKEQKTGFCQYLWDWTFPDGFCSNMGKCISVPTHKITGLKTHDCHILL